MTQFTLFPTADGESEVAEVATTAPKIESRKEIAWSRTEVEDGHDSIVRRGDTVRLPDGRRVTVDNLRTRYISGDWRNEVRAGGEWHAAWQVEQLFRPSQSFRASTLPQDGR